MAGSRTGRHAWLTRLLAFALLPALTGVGSAVSLAQTGLPARPAPAPSSATPAPPTTGTNTSSATPQNVFPLTPDQVAAHLGKTADWFHHLAPVEQLQVAAADSLAREKLRQQSLTAVRLAVEFGKACAALLDAQSRQAQSKAQAASAASPAPAGASSRKGFAGRLDQAAADVAQRIDTLQSQFDDLKEEEARTRGKKRDTLIAQQGQVAAALQLAREVQASVKEMENFEASSIAGDKANLSPLDAQIADIERSVPELRTSGRGSSTNAASGTGASGASASGSRGSSSGAPGSNASSSGTSSSNAPRPASAFQPENAGIIALVTQWFSLHDVSRQLGGYLKETGALQDGIEKVRTPLVNQVRVIVGDDLAISTSTDPAQLVAQRQALEADAARFKQLSAALVPLGDQALTVESTMATLKEWRDTLDDRMDTVARYLAVRIIIVLGWIAVVLIVSDIWRRATFRYLHDQRRRRQFLMLRRVAVGIALTLVIIFGLVSEIGSIATYIGFVTAGVAVALQNVILAVVAYFFLIGRYGVRVGDRITLAGVTGRVVDIGLVRIYLMELAGADLHVTGRMVVLSNAVLFQPTAMFKQIPGADYVWHTVTLTIAATADVTEAHKRLRTAAEEVYQKYRPAIERQHQMVQRFIDFDASSPQPEVRLRLTENGLECSVRYPVELDNAAVIDQQMLKSLRDALEHDSQFKLVATGAVVLRSSSDT
jgi:small-conductance mechanosensitive channel